VITKHCYVIESDTGFANYAAKTNMHVIVYVVEVFIKYFSIIARERKEMLCMKKIPELLTSLV
jgi:hypothetical protein